MTMRHPLALLSLLLIPKILFADMLTPGFVRVPLHVVFEVTEAYPEYQFWLVWDDGPQRMEIAPGKPFHAVGGKNFRWARIVAVPLKTAETLTKSEVMELLEKGKAPQVFTSYTFDNFKSLPFYDSRREVVSTFRISLDPDKKVDLEFLGSEPEPWWSKVVRYVVGISLSVGITWAGFLFIRWLRRRFAKA
jgi:hypothetical protein